VKQAPPGLSKGFPGQDSLRVAQSEWLRCAIRDCKNWHDLNGFVIPTRLFVGWAVFRAKKWPARMIEQATKEKVSPKNRIRPRVARPQLGPHLRFGLDKFAKAKNLVESIDCIVRFLVLIRPTLTFDLRCHDW
jgi:hypothetical protein